jgi:transmembrane sensor
VAGAERIATSRTTSVKVILVVAALALGAMVLRTPAASLFGGSARSERIVTGIGQRRTIRLTDGSRIDLGVATTIVHPNEFANDRRAVTVAGEAYFTVATDSARSFIVTAPYATISTSGASFAVRAYPEESDAQVVVAEGTVRIRSPSAADSEGIAVDSGQLARITRAGRISRQDSVDVARLTAWRRGRIILGGVPLRAALVEVGRWQDIELRIADSVVANRRVTAEFATTQTLTEILDEIALGIGAVYEWQGRVVTFRRER